MPTTQRSVLTLSLPRDMAREYKELANKRGESASELFREMYSDWRRESALSELEALQEYGKGRAARLRIKEADIERLVFGDR